MIAVITKKITEIKHLRDLSFITVIIPNGARR